LHGFLLWDRRRGSDVLPEKSEECPNRSGEASSPALAHRLGGRRAPWRAPGLPRPCPSRCPSPPARPPPLRPRLPWRWPSRFVSPERFAFRPFDGGTLELSGVLGGSFSFASKAATAPSMMRPAPTERRSRRPSVHRRASSIGQRRRSHSGIGSRDARPVNPVRKSSRHARKPTQAEGS